MLHLLYPCEYVESVFAIDYRKLYQRGYRGVIFDIDNTLVPHGKDSTPEVDELFRAIRAVGLRPLLLSNNSEARIRRFLKNIDALYIDQAQKPRPANYRRAAELLGVDRSQVVFIGDQVFTDILGANLSGIDSILVKFIGHDTETRLGIRRNLEKIVLKLYSLGGSRRHRLGDILREEAAPNAAEETVL